MLNQVQQFLLLQVQRQDSEYSQTGKRPECTIAEYVRTDDQFGYGKTAESCSTAKLRMANRGLYMNGHLGIVDWRRQVRFQDWGQAVPYKGL